MGDLGKIIVATGFENLPKVQQIAQFGHTGQDTLYHTPMYPYLHRLTYTSSAWENVLALPPYPVNTKDFNPKGLEKAEMYVDNRYDIIASLSA